MQILIIIVLALVVVTGLRLRYLTAQITLTLKDTIEYQECHIKSLEKELSNQEHKLLDNHYKRRVHLEERVEELESLEVFTITHE